jgi:hypothetical protein
MTVYIFPVGRANEPGESAMLCCAIRRPPLRCVRGPYERVQHAAVKIIRAIRRAKRDQMKSQRWTYNTPLGVGTALQAGLSLPSAVTARGQTAAGYGGGIYKVRFHETSTRNRWCLFFRRRRQGTGLPRRSCYAQMVCLISVEFSTAATSVVRLKALHVRLLSKVDSVREGQLHIDTEYVA